MDSGSLHISSGSGMASNQERRGECDISSLLDHEKVHSGFEFIDTIYL